MKNWLLIAILAIVCLISFSQRSVSQLPVSSACSDDHVLRVTYFSGKEPSFQRVSSDKVQGQSVSYSLFKINSNWQRPAGVLPVAAVSITPTCEGQTVSIEVSVVKGKLRERELVGIYLITPDRMFRISDLSRFGIEPFEITLIPGTPSKTNIPAINNQTSSLHVSVDSVAETLPTLKIEVLNKGNKQVSAFSLEITANGITRLVTMRRGEKGRVLIEPGKTYVMTMPAAVDSTSGPDSDKLPMARLDEMLIIKSVVFADGSFEGDEEEAAVVGAFNLGTRIQIENILAILDKALLAEPSPTIVGEIYASVKALPDKVVEAQFAEFMKRYGHQDEKRVMKLRVAAAVSTRSTKANILNEIEVIRSRKWDDTKVSTLTTWMTESRKEFASWRDRLSH